MNDQWLDAARPAIENAWHKASPNASYFCKLESISKVYRAFCRQKAQHFMMEEASARSNFSSASIDLQTHLEDPELQAKHGSTRLHLQDVESKKVVGQRIKSQIRWKIRGDLVSAEFFKATREKPASSAITGLRNTQGQLIEEPNGLRQVCSNFYSRLYSTRPESPACLEAMDEFLGLLFDDIPLESKSSLSFPLSSQELKLALDEMAPHKSPGPDDFITEFYQ